MATIVLAVGRAQLSAHGKRMVATSMYTKGKAFLGAAILLRQTGGYEFIVLHLLCQGIEVALKGILLLIDYDKYKPKIRRIGHNLSSVSDAAIKAAGLSSLRPDVRAELAVLSNLYSQHLLRYGSGYDILVNPSTIPSQRVLRRMVAVLRLVESKGIANDPTISQIIPSK
jgi:hypothetical protein